jgi:hypothetical protein
MINEFDKIKLKTGEIAVICEILEKNIAYIAEVYNRDGKMSVEQIAYGDIASVFEEVERPIA